jgi:hypothetical protein
MYCKYKTTVALVGLAKQVEKERGLPYLVKAGKQAAE